MNLLIIGAPGAGKGTMSELIINKYQITHVSTGDMLRQAIKEATPVGLKAQEYMDQGKLVPDSIIHDIILERLNKKDIDQGFLFDGYPRTINQAIDLQDILDKLNKKIDCVINLDIQDEELTKRITGRRICPKCQEIYNIYNLPPTKEGKCDKCGSDLITRIDDNLESLVTRLAEYHTNTQPIIAYYKKMDLVKDVKANEPIETIFNNIVSILEGLK